jgi:hypothetical protein
MLQRRWLLDGGLAIALFLLISALAVTKAFSQDTPALDSAKASPFTLSGPYTFKNLSVYLVHGKDRVKGKKYLTLAEAMRRKKVRVYETGNVNELTIENISRNEEIYIQSGDIVKGGRQDRTVSFDFVLAPRSGRVPLAAFCVEQSRWSRRASESDREFGSSEEQLVSRDLKIAAKHDNNQGKVWDKVKKTQEKLTDNLGVSVQSGTSTSSLQLSLENPEVRKLRDEYIRALERITKGEKDVIGYAFAINGEVNSADVYGSSALFTTLWPRLLRSASVEAILNKQSDSTVAIPGSPTISDVHESLIDIEERADSTTEKQVTPETQMVTNENSKAYLFETRDSRLQGEWIHRNYILK